MNEQVTERRNAHPIAGWMCVLEREGAERSHEEPRSFFDALMAAQAVNVTAAVVIEVGTLPEGEATEYMIPYSPGCVVYYSDDRGIKIGDYTFIQVTSVIAWDPA